MAEFQWWLLLVGLVAGGAIVALMTMDTARRDDDLPDDEQAAEATFIAAQLLDAGEPLDREAVARVLRAHRDYLRLPPPDAIVAVGPGPAGTPSTGDGHPDDEAHDVGHGRGGRPDPDLPRA